MTQVYLDTSVPSAYFDYTKPVRQLITQRWFESEIKNYKIYVSTIVFEELSRYKNINKREAIEDLLIEKNVVTIDITEEAVLLAEKYIKEGAFPKTERIDALHTAVATINEVDALASWNFKHIVSVNPIKKIHEINLKENYKIIEIGSLEIFGGAKYGNLS